MKTSFNCYVHTASINEPHLNSWRAVCSCCRRVKECSITASHSSCRALRIAGMLVALGGFGLATGGTDADRDEKLNYFCEPITIFLTLLFLVWNGNLLFFYQLTRCTQIWTTVACLPLVLVCMAEQTHILQKGKTSTKGFQISKMFLCVVSLKSKCGTSFYNVINDARQFGMCQYYFHQLSFCRLICPSDDHSEERTGVPCMNEARLVRRDWVAFHLWVWVKKKKIEDIYFSDP